MSMIPTFQCYSPTFSRQRILRGISKFSDWKGGDVKFFPNVKGGCKRFTWIWLMYYGITKWILMCKIVNNKYNSNWKNTEYPSVKNKQLLKNYYGSKGLIPRALSSAKCKEFSSKLIRCMRSKDKLVVARNNFTSSVSRSQFYSLRKRIKWPNSIESLIRSHSYFADTIIII